MSALAVAYLGVVDVGRDLTPREQQVLLLVCRGCTNKEIARSLRVSIHTVHVHVGAILLKTGAGNRTEAAVLAVERGLLAPRAQI